MPELPEVETTRRGISPHIVGKPVTKVVLRDTRLRWPIPADLGSRIENHCLQQITRRGKYLLLHFTHGTVLWHLGMSGSLRIILTEEAATKHDHVDWVFPGNIILRFNDPRRFGALLWTDDAPENHFLIHHLGPEPLSEHFDGIYLYQQSRKRQQAIKTWLMDAKIVVGVGNIYANEALFASGIHPTRAAGRLTKPQCITLATHIKRILTHAIIRGGTTLRDFVGGDGKPGYFAQELNVYGRGGLPCHVCQKALTEKRVAQRTTVYCTRCQT